MEVKKKTASSTRGFSLIELLVALVILAAVATGGLATYTRSLIRGRDAQRKADLANIQKALVLYYNDYEQYPDDDGGGEISLAGWGDEFKDASDTVYMKQLPQDPQSPSQDYYYRVVDAANQKYQLYTLLENEEDPQIMSLSGPPECGSGEDCNYGVSSPNQTL